MPTVFTTKLRRFLEPSLAQPTGLFTKYRFLMMRLPAVQRTGAGAKVHTLPGGGLGKNSSGKPQRRRLRGGQKFCGKCVGFFLLR
jgi:hypothetical protein